MTLRFLAGLVAVVISAGRSRGDEPPAKKILVEFGWDEPDTGFLRKHVREMEATPFDGCVFHADGRGAGGETLSLAWKFWGRRGFTRDEFAAALADLGATRWGRFRQNYLRVNTTPADLDWFDDFAPVLANARLAAGLAREGRCRGILLDTEAYETNLFHYPSQRHAKDRSWDDYASQARRRGREVMGAFQDAFPGLTVLLTFGPSLVRAQSGGGTKPPDGLESGLLSPFVEGLAGAARDGSRVIDGHEMSYGYRDARQFDEALASIRKGGPNVQAGFGLWLDYDWRKKGWNTDDPSKNYFSPARFGASVRAALERSDGVVWVYTETPRWWTERGGPEKLPGPYVDALRAARKGLTED